MTRRPDLQPQPCGHCGKPVPPGTGRAQGQTWWHANQPECRAVRKARPTRLRHSQPCGHCGRPVRPGAGRRRGQTWWCRHQECQRARRRKLEQDRRARKRAGAAERAA